MGFALFHIHSVKVDYVEKRVNYIQNYKKNDSYKNIYRYRQYFQRIFIPVSKIIVNFAFVMKIRIIILGFISMLAFVSYAQVSLGVRDNRYVNVGYEFGNHWNVKFEQSVYSETLSCQYFRVYAGYGRQIRAFTLKVLPYFGMTYNNGYRNAGFSMQVQVSPLKWLGMEGDISPHYDSDLGYKTCYVGKLSYIVHPQIAISAGITNKPEYREPERRVRAGIKFTVNNLWAYPELSLPAQSHSKAIRMLVSLGYAFR